MSYILSINSPCSRNIFPYPLSPPSPQTNPGQGKEEQQLETLPTTKILDLNLPYHPALKVPHNINTVDKARSHKELCKFLDRN